MIYLCSHRNDIPYELGDEIEFVYLGRTKRGVIVAFESLELRSLDEDSSVNLACLIALTNGRREDKAITTVNEYLEREEDRINTEHLGTYYLKKHGDLEFEWADPAESTLVSYAGKERDIGNLLHELEKEVRWQS